MREKEPIVTEYRYYADCPRKFSVLHLSDLHNCVYGHENKKLIGTCRKCAPDLIFATGDILNKMGPEHDIAEDFLCKLTSIAPVFYSLGNHELVYKKRYKKEYEAYVNGLKKGGVCVLDDETTLVEIDGYKLEIGGFSADFEGYRRNSRTKVYDRILEPGTNADLKLLLAHSPEFFESYETSDWDIFFGGHMHGGIVRLFGRGVISPSLKLFPKYTRGYYALKNGKKMLVSAGLGDHSIKFRLFNPHQIIKLTVGKSDILREEI